MNTTNTCHGFAADALGDSDAVDIAERIRKREVSAREVVAAAIRRAQQVEPSLCAIEVETFSAALASADSYTKGPFAGVPIFVKDAIDIRGLPTNMGSRALRALPARKDERFSEQLWAQGFVCLGKSKMPELGFNASNEFVGAPSTRNPWNKDYSSGASSGGSAALVASGVVPIAHGNDGGGSIRIPAAACGLVGLKPTRGRLIFSNAARHLPIKIVAEGVLTRSVRDTAEFYRNQKLAPIGLVTGPSSRRLRIGLVVDSVVGSGTDADTRAAVMQAASLLESLGHHVEPIALPAALQTFAEDFSLYWGLLAFFGGRFGKATVGRNFDATQLEPLSLGLASYYYKNAHRTPALLYRLHKSAKHYAEMFEIYDAVLSPVVAHTTPKLGHLAPDVPFEQLFERLRSYVSFTPLNNATGSPAIALPFGASRDGMPIGIHLSGAHGGERSLLELSFELEQAQPFRRIQDRTSTSRNALEV
jgi:amidase